MAEKRKRRKKQREEVLEEETEEEYPFFDARFDIEGMLRIELSFLTQRVIGCVMGEDLTTEDPWIFIPKEKIEDNLELHDESSEFLPILSVIQSYPGTEMLIGFNKSISDEKHEFLLCSTIGVRNKVMAILEQQKIEMQERLKQSVTKTPGKWHSCGSEEEVDDNIIKNTRPLIELEVDTIYPLCSDKKKFRLRLVDAAVDGYIEILPGRFPTTHVYRKRVDAAVQVTATTQENEAQTNPTYPKNAWTQYKYEFSEPKLNAQQLKDLIAFVLGQADSLCETIHVNQHIDLYDNDYKRMSKPVRASVPMYNRDIVQFREVVTCKDKLVTALDLDPFKSGIFASAFGRFSQNSTYTEHYTADFVNETIFGTHLVLIWCISDNLRPKLILRSEREVSCLRYCPFRKNLLVGGCTNGQIVIWDLEGRLERVETVEILSQTEMGHRMILRQLMTWMKETDKINEVYPTAVSNLNYCHSDSVLQIAWVLPNYEITRNGKLLDHSVEALGDNLQFMSVGLDGRVLIWDLLKTPDLVPAPKAKKSQRLKERPPALTTNVSDFRALNRLLTPIFKVNVRDKVHNYHLPTSSFVIKNLKYTFIPVNPETLTDVYKRTYFERGPPVLNYKFTQSFGVGDILGHFLYCSFDGHDYDQGQRLNYEDCKFFENTLIHDGPIRSCVSNRLDEDVFLTVGGRIFAVWDVKMPGNPILWRKCAVKYIAGCWSSAYAVAVIVQREDSYMESWDLVFRTKSPGRIIRIKGNPILEMFSDQQKLHCSKMTFTVSSKVGAVRLYKIPPLKQVPASSEQLSKGHRIVHRILLRRNQYISWLTEWKKKYMVEEEPTDDAAPEGKKEEPENKEKEKEKEKKQSIVEQEKEKEKKQSFVEKEKERKSTVSEKAGEVKEDKFGEEAGQKKTEVKIPAAELWLEKQQKMMYSILLQKKRLNIAELERNKIPLQNLIHDQQKKLEKQNEMIAEKDQIFNNAVKAVIKQATIKRREKYEALVPEEVADLMKESYIESYKEQETKVLQQVLKNQFRFVFDWSEMLNQGRQRRTSLTSVLSKAKRTYSRFFKSSVDFRGINDEREGDDDFSV